jgi:hypothetical protein
MRVQGRTPIVAPREGGAGSCPALPPRSRRAPKRGDLVLRTLALLRGLDPKPRILIDLNPTDFEEDWRRAAAAMDRALQLITHVGPDGFGFLRRNGFLASGSSHPCRPAFRHRQPQLGSGGTRGAAPMVLVQRVHGTVFERGGEQVSQGLPRNDALLDRWRTGAGRLP